MAKILRGPLAAGISGSIGPLVFRDTRFGQVVQAGSGGGRHDTAAHNATIDNFRAAASSWVIYFNQVNRIGSDWAKPYVSDFRQRWIGNLIAWGNGNRAFDPWPQLDGSQQQVRLWCTTGVDHYIIKLQFVSGLILATPFVWWQRGEQPPLAGDRVDSTSGPAQFPFPFSNIGPTGVDLVTSPTRVGGPLSAVSNVLALHLPPVP